MEGRSSKNKVIYALSIVIISIFTVILVIGGTLKLYGTAKGLSDTDSSTPFIYKPVIVVSGSMLPAIQINSLNIVKSCSFDDLEKGDILMYEADNGMMITHRVIDFMGEDYVIVKGDNNQTEDAPVRRDQVRGKIVFTWNAIAPLLSDIIPQNGAYNAVSMIRAVSIILLIISISIIIIQYLIDLLKAIIFRRYTDEKYAKYLREYIDTCKSEIWYTELELNRLEKKSEDNSKENNHLTLSDYLHREKNIKDIKELREITSRISKSHKND